MLSELPQSASALSQRSRTNTIAQNKRPSLFARGHSCRDCHLSWDTRKPYLWTTLTIWNRVQCFHRWHNKERCQRWGGTVSWLVPNCGWAETSIHPTAWISINEYNWAWPLKTWKLFGALFPLNGPCPKWIDESVVQKSVGFLTTPGLASPAIDAWIDQHNDQWLKQSRKFIFNCQLEIAWNLNEFQVEINHEKRIGWYIGR